MHNITGIYYCLHSNYFLDIVAHEYDIDRETYVMHVKEDSPFQPNTNYIVTIPFIAILNDDLDGFYRSSYMENGKYFKNCINIYYAGSSWYHYQFLNF